jgi:hypothetical protein
MSKAPLVMLLGWPLLADPAAAGNPLDLGHAIRTADPSAHVWADGRLYLYTSHDQECQADFHMRDWHAFSTADLKTWTAHGAVLSLDGVAWADNYAWAPDAAFRNGQYYLVFPAGTGHKDRVHPARSSKWMGIGVAVSPSPTGPFRDALGGPLWREPYANDPALFVDDDGRIWLYFHGRDFDYRVVELRDDLKGLKGDFIRMDMGGHEPKMEGPWVFKRDGTYYFTMPENNRALAHYTADAPTGPWRYRGVFMAEEHASNNHHSIVQFQGRWVLFYHRWLATPGCAKRQRQVAAEWLQFDPDGRIRPVRRTRAGLDAPPPRTGSDR